METAAATALMIVHARGASLDLGLLSGVNSAKQIDINANGVGSTLAGLKTFFIVPKFAFVLLLAHGIAAQSRGALAQAAVLAVGERAAAPALEAELRGYADYMETDSFRRAASQLITMASEAPTTILCAERLPEHCHRRLIADYLVLQGLRVIHLIDPGEVREHVLSAEARRESAQLVYDRNATLELNL